MNISKISSKQIDQIIDFMYDLNNCQNHHIGYCGKNKVEIKSTVAELIEDGNEFFAIYEENKLIGVMGYEKYDDTVEIWGPFIKENNLQALDMLWENLLRLIDDDKCNYQIHCNTKNFIAREFALSKGFITICEGKTMELDLYSMKIPVYDNISKIEECDYNEVAKLHDITFPNAYYKGEQIIDMLDNENVIFVAKEADKLVGYAFVSMNLEFSEGDIEFIGVDVSYRGKSYGRKLLCTVLNSFKENGITRLQLWVNIENQNAINLYSSVGFATIDNLISFKKSNK